MLANDSTPVSNRLGLTALKVSIGLGLVEHSNFATGLSALINFDPLAHWELFCVYMRCANISLLN